jgi:hypothetical protein
MNQWTVPSKASHLRGGLRRRALRLLNRGARDGKDIRRHDMASKRSKARGCCRCRPCCRRP